MVACLSTQPLSAAGVEIECSLSNKPASELGRAKNASTFREKMAPAEANQYHSDRVKGGSRWGVRGGAQLPGATVARGDVPRGGRGAHFPRNSARWRRVGMRDAKRRGRNLWWPAEGSATICTCPRRLRLLPRGGCVGHSSWSAHKLLTTRNPFGGATLSRFRPR